MLFILAILPVIILLCVIYFFDKFEKEPWWLLALAFALGALIPIPILYLSENIQNIPIPNFYLQKFYHAFIEVALREEGFKFLILFLLIWWSKYFNEYFDGIVYAVFISLGFACVENIMYIVDSYSGVRIALGRAIFSVPGHAIDAIIMGYYFSLAKFIPKRKVIYLAASLSFAVLVHGLYDLFLFWCHAQNNWFPYVSITFFYILVIFMYLLGIWKIKVLKDQQLPNNEANEKIENESFILFIRGILKNMKSICLLIFNKMKTNKKTVFINPTPQYL